MFSGGGGWEAGAGEGEVKEPALTGVHGWKRVGSTGGADGLDGLFGGDLELFFAGCPKSVDVEEDAVVGFGFESEDRGGDLFDRVKKFGVSGRQDG